MTRYRLYTDGSSHARGGKPGGWGWILVKLAGDGVAVPMTAEPVASCSGGHPDTSNNRMEMTAVLNGLKYIGNRLVAGAHVDIEVEICSDSPYALNMAAGTWNASSNLDIVEQLRLHTRELGLAGVKIKFSWVRGHNGEPWNELVDGLATRAKAKPVAALTKTPGS